ncbi:hypothetical protein DID96_37465 [Burkholderia sp. Bp8963]|nr:hypothetical protein DID96_37465 [Burkholderia sp. Bp8963]
MPNKTQRRGETRGNPRQQRSAGRMGGNPPWPSLPRRDSHPLPPSTTVTTAPGVRIVVVSFDS